MEQDNYTENYEKLFSKIPTAKAPEHLFVDIETGIHAAYIHKNRVRGTIYAITACLAIAGFIPAAKYMIDSMINSGFTSFISVLITDGANIFGSWKELGLALAESLPVLSITAVVTLLIGSIYSMSKSMSYIRSLKIASF